MGNFEGVSDTQFIGAGEFGAVTSYQPCHLFADPMLIGLGIRLAFYLLYIGAILAVLFGVDSQFRFWHGSWGTISLATLVALAVNSTNPNPNNLLFIDWAILIQLVLWYPVFLFFSIFLRQTYSVRRTSSVNSPEAIQARLQAHRAAVTARDAAYARAYADVLRAMALHAAATEAEDQYLQAQADLAGAMQTFVGYWHEEVRVVDERYRREEDISVEATAVTTVFHPAAIAEVAAAPTKTDVEMLRDVYVAAMVQAQMSEQEARAMEQEVAAIVAEELQLKRRAMKPKHAAREFLLGTSVKDRIAAGLALLVWSAYMLATPALYWPLLNNGRKSGCDDRVWVLFVLAPKQPFVDPGFTTFLRVWTVGVVIVAVITTLIGLYFLLVAIFGRRAVIWHSKRSRRGKGKRKGVAEADENVLVEEQAASARSPRHSHRARRKHADEILDCIHHPESRTVTHRYRRRSRSPMRFSLANIPWAILLAVLLVETIATVEKTIVIDNLDFVRPPMHETAEILAFFVGLFALVLILGSILQGLVATLLQRRRRHHHAHHHSHHHQVHEEKRA